LSNFYLKDFFWHFLGLALAKRIAVLDNSLKIFLVDDAPAGRCLLVQAVRLYGRPDVLRPLRRKSSSGQGVAALFNPFLIVTRFSLSNLS
jgi:hypothetical protein